jgi:hypothetical protein
MKGLFSVYAAFVVVLFSTMSLWAASPTLPKEELRRGKITGGATAVYDPTIPEELRVRDGLPHFFAKLKSGGPVRIAYLGGSITAARGWRPKTFAWFQSHYPNAELIEINAAISGTGSDFGACRIVSDVLTQDPDLVFMKNRVPLPSR